MRRYYLDNIRWGTVLLVMVYHVCYLFNGVGIPGAVGPGGSIRALDMFASAVYPWFMVLLFLVAGISARYALQRRTGRQFLRSRCAKLLIPSTLGLFVFHWITGWLNIMSGGALATIPPAIRYPIFVLSGTGPLWFAQMLFLFSALLLLIRKLDRQDRLWNFCGRANLSAVLLMGVLVWAVSQVGNLPVITVYRFGIYGAVFFLGYFVFSHDRVQALVEAAHIPMLISALALGILYLWRYWGANYTSPECLQSLLTNAYLWAAVLSVLGCAKAWFDRTSRFAGYMTRLSFGLYVLHYPVVLSACYLLYHYCALPPVLNYLLALIAELAVTPLLYALLSRIPVVRRLVLGIGKKMSDKP